jgi:hypothetical protein
MLFLFYISYSHLTPGVMKSLIVAAFLLCSCAIAYSQQTSSHVETPAAETINVDLSQPPPEPLFVISEGGILKEASKEDLEKLTITQIASVEFLIDSESLLAYGEKGKNGVMIISLKED